MTSMMSASIPTQVCVRSRGPLSEANPSYASFGFKLSVFLKTVFSSVKTALGYCMDLKSQEQEGMWVTQKVALSVTQSSASLAVSRSR